MIERDRRLFAALWIMGAINQTDVDQDAMKRLINDGLVCRDGIIQPWHEQGPLIRVGFNVRLSKAGKALADKMFTPRPHPAPVLLLPAPKVTALLTGGTQYEADRAHNREVAAYWLMVATRQTVHYAERES